MIIEWEYGVSLAELYKKYDLANVQEEIIFKMMPKPETLPGKHIKIKRKKLRGLNHMIKDIKKKRKSNKAMSRLNRGRLAE